MPSISASVGMDGGAKERQNKAYLTAPELVLGRKQIQLPVSYQLRSLSDEPSGALQVGFDRNISALTNQTFGSSSLIWRKSHSNGQINKVSGFSVTSMGAVATRLGLRIYALPSSATLTFYSLNASKNVEITAVVTGADVKKMIAQNYASDGDSAVANVYWSPLVYGSEISVEVVLPADAAETVSFSIDSLAHLFQDPAYSLDEQGLGDGDDCQINVACDASWTAERAGTARMIFSKNGGTYACTGSLLNDSDDATQIPYFITANHCISTQVVASSLITYWMYRADSCGGTALSSVSETRGGGAALLWTQGEGSNAMDVTVLRLNQSPPIAAYFLETSLSEVAADAAVFGIHHPQGDLKKISVGKRGTNASCTVSTSGSFACSPNILGNYAYVDWLSGDMEGGSSGSGLFNASKALVGVLKGGRHNTNCSGTSYYSRFNKAYAAGNLAQFFTRQSVEDNYENNDSRLSSYDLGDYEGVWLSSINGKGTQLDSDWYKIQVTEAKPLLSVYLDFQHLFGDIDLALYDSSGAFITHSESASNDEYISYLSSEPGDYYLRVYNGNAGTQYNLKWHTAKDDDFLFMVLPAILAAKKKRK